MDMKVENNIPAICKFYIKTRLPGRAIYSIYFVFFTLYLAFIVLYMHCMNVLYLS
jgi:hypothetical protein